MVKMARKMATANLQARSRWSQMTMLMLPILLFMTLSLVEFSLGQTDSCGNSGYLCPEGQCCNKYNECGNTTAYCGADCSSQCPIVSSQCGPQFGSTPCPSGSCCSIYSWCGTVPAYCGSLNCSSQCPNGTCGVNGGTCPPGSCCNQEGYCGNNVGYCGPANCASQCPPAPPSPGPASPSPGLITAVLKKPSGSKVAIIVGGSVGAAVFLIVLVGCLAVFKWKRRSVDRGELDHFTEGGSQIFVEGMPTRFSYRQLSVATAGFSQESKLGQGGFGSVYSGVLPSSGIPVAVKKINSESSQGEKEFLAEVSIISQLRHRNLIQLQGWCKDYSVKEKLYLLVYDLMPNGSLDKALFGPEESQTVCLSWSQRFNILTGTAAAVEYLHRGWKQQVIHRDIKSSNIMLDEEWNAKLGDFGLARFVDHQRTAAATTVVAGTYGYIAPEAILSGRFTEKTDVYAFGAVALEIACGRKALAFELPPEEAVLVDWVWGRLSEGNLLRTVDVRLEDYDEYWMKVVLMVGLLCSHPDPEARPSMRRVVEILAGDVQVPAIPGSKPAPIYSSSSGDIFIHASKRSPKMGRTSKSMSESSTFPGYASSLSDDAATKDTLSLDPKDTVSTSVSSSLIHRAR